MWRGIEAARHVVLGLTVLLALVSLRSNEERLAAQTATNKPKDAGERVRAVGHKAKALWDEGKQQEATEKYAAAVKLAKKILGPRAPGTVAAMNDLGEAHRLRGQYDQAVIVHEKCVEIRESRNDADLSQSLNNLALAYVAQGQHARAEPLYERSLELYEARKDDVNAAQVLMNLGELYYAARQYKKAEPVFERALALRENKLGKEEVPVGIVVNRLGLLYKETGEHAKAETFFRRALSIFETKQGKDHLNAATVRNNLGDLLTVMGQYAKAEPFYQTSLEIRESKLGKDHVDVATSLNALANLYQYMGKYAKVERLYRRSLQIREARLGKEHASVGTSYISLAILYRAMGKYSEAEPLGRRGLEIQEARLGKDSPELISGLNVLGHIYVQLAQYKKAEPLYQRALALAEAKLGKDSPQAATCLTNLAAWWSGQGNTEQAETYYQRCLQIQETKLGKDHTDVATTLNHLGLLYQGKGQYLKAEPLLQRSLEINETKLGKDHINAAFSMHNLAGLYKDMGQYARAESLYKRSCEIRESRLGTDHPFVADSVNNLGLFYQAMGQYTRAESCYQRALQIREQKLGKEHQSVGESLNNLGILHTAMSEPAKAEPLLKRALELYEANLGPNHPHIAIPLNNLANIYRDQGRYGEAEPLYRRSEKIIATTQGKDHPRLAMSLSNQAVLLAYQAEYDRAAALLERAVDISRARLGKDHPSTAALYGRLAGVQAARKHLPQAVRTMDGALHSLRRHAVTVLPILADSEQLEFLDNSFTRQLRTGLSLALAGTLDEENRYRTASWLLNGKAIAQESLAERLILARDNDTPEARKTLAALKEVRRELASATIQDDAGRAPTARSRLEELRDTEKRLQTSLNAFDIRSKRDDPWFELDELRQRLPAKTVFVDFALLPVRNFKAENKDEEWLPSRYVAWVIFKEGDVRIVDLGPANAIAEAVKNAQAALKAGPQLIGDKGEEQATQALSAPLQELSKRLLEPLRKHLDTAERWILSPDGTLWLVPWAALPLDDKTFAVEKHTIELVVSGRDLLLSPLKLDRKPSAPLVLADPDFNLGRRETSRPSPTAKHETRTASASLHLGNVKRLPYTAAEAEAIAPRLNAWTKTPSRVLTGKQAQVGVVKATTGPRVLVISTHGFFLPDQETKPGASGTKSPKENPLLRCGLLLAGCNNPLRSAEAEDDGVLTGLEVAGSDLRGTELVVLSACETGLGEVHNGEGVAGLRQAFQLAGAEAVVATLWQIPDRQSAQLMVRFFDELAGGKSKADALRDAQRAMIQARREKSGAAHPFFWAAYTLTGQ